MVHLILVSEHNNDTKFTKSSVRFIIYNTEGQHEGSQSSGRWNQLNVRAMVIADL